MVDDNFHYMDVTERREGADFDTLEAALEQGKRIVDLALRHLYRSGMTPEELYDYYQDFGDDPFIVSSDSRCDFSAWNYAKSRCAAICSELGKNEAS
jgi:hypothetical protein